MTREDKAYSFLAAEAAVAGGTLLAAKIGRSVRNHYKEKPLKKERESRIDEDKTCYENTSPSS